MKTIIIKIVIDKIDILSIQVKSINHFFLDYDDDDDQ